ncbi:ROK family protein [Nocardioides bizhenqiangii]|uniref:ROK family protein n=1 Tax=Nocardioides bizhenqiangii TaxID=3095076 RepID=A0ABZ0ZL55_9ACTN|nr:MULTISPECIES: ROK family protein [unclassified Nocardioides]MDZ5620691.1 ROK family protein [Nocardioides sp. HM23]WQQ25057.1 ROK family protein [Nocardioides sp. HM61]
MHVGVDVGGTKVLAVELAGEGGAVVVASSAQAPMPGRSASEADVEAAVAGAVLEVAAGRPLSGVGLSAAGLVDRSGARVRFAAHLPWRDAPVRDRLAERIGAPVVLDNDANCAAHAELVAGALRGVSSAVLVTVGTGIGGAVVLDGRVLRGANGMAGEFGHIQVVPDGLACECGLRGCWEQYCSGRALERVTRVALGSHLDGPEVADLARNGHPVAQQAFATVGTWLGVGIAGLVSALDPEMVVVGGGVSVVGDLLLEPARRGLLDALQATSHRKVPPLVATRFGPEAGAVGAALLSAAHS